MNANVDVRKKSEINKDLRLQKKKQRNERVAELKLLPADAHAIVSIKNGEITSWKNRYQASLKLGLNSIAILDCLLGLMEKTNDGTTWKWKVE